MERVGSEPAISVLAGRRPAELDDGVRDIVEQRRD
jgi:hypothetical protein